MLQTGASFAVYEPTLRGQKDKNENQNTKNVPLPCIPCVRPKEEILYGAKHKLHRSPFTSTRFQAILKPSAPAGDPKILLICLTIGVNKGPHIWTLGAGSIMC